MSYLEILLDLHEWLKRHQVAQENISAIYKNGNLRYLLSHPTKGIVEVVQNYPESEYFQSCGIGLKIKERNNVKVEIDVYDYGGIFDPIDNRVQGEHYSASHFALLSAILFVETKNDGYLDCAKKAVRFHLSTYKDKYYFASWTYHWDFQNYAFLECFLLLKDYLTEMERKQWLEGIKSWKTNTHDTTNWSAMRAYAFLLRSRLLHSKIDIIKYWRNLRIIKRAQLRDGSLQDKIGKSCPIQYHIFTAAILHRIYQIESSKEIRRRFLSGISYFRNFIDDEGDFNYFGRGQGQIFGYGSALYALEAAKIVDRPNNREYQYFVDKIWNYLLQYKKEDGHFPLTLNNRPDQEKCGWYDYHHLTVYNAFLGAWLGLTHLLRSERVPVKISSRRKTTFYTPSQIAIVDNDEYFLVISGGFCDYISEAGLTFHHLSFREIGWIFSCPGGPSIDEFGKINVVENVERNFFSPIALDSNNKWINPSRKKGKILKADSEQIIVTLDYGPFSVERTVFLNNKSIVINDKIYFQKSMHLKEFRYFNFPVVIDKFRIELLDGKMNIVERDLKKKISIKILKNTFNNSEFETLEMIKTAKGLAQVISLRDREFLIKKYEKRDIEFQIEKTIE